MKLFGKPILFFISSIFTATTFFFLVTLNIVGIHSAHAADPPELIDINTGSGDSYPGDFVDLNGVAIFAADDGENGTELWRSDGTVAGTVMVKDILPGADSGYPEDFVVVGDTVFFIIWDGSLWKTDGTEAETTLVKDVYISTLYGVNVNGKLFFYADDGTHGDELWISDGTTSGTEMVKDITIGSEGSITYQQGRAVGNKFIFSVDDSLWVSDGTGVGTEQISSDLSVSQSAFRYSAVFDGNVYFDGEDATYGSEPWKSNGTSIGTTLLKDVVSGSSSSSPTPFISFNNQIYFFTYDDELYKSDGTEGNTVKVHDMDYYTDFDMEHMVEMGNDLYFVAEDEDSNYGDELWKIEGDTGVASMVKDIYPGSGDSDLEDLTVIGNTLYFSATDDSEDGWNTEPWISDGTEAGTEMLANINPDYDEGSYPEAFADIDSKAFFNAWTTTYGTELYVVDSETEVSNDSALSNLVISGCSMSPSFDSGTTSYSCEVSSSVTSIIITGTTSFLGATMKIEGNTVSSGDPQESNLATGVNEINIVVTAEDGTSETDYVLSVTKLPEEILIINDLTPASAPNCTDNPPSKPPDLFQIDTSNNSATLYFAPAGNPVNKYYISYGEIKDQMQYGVEYNQNYANGVLDFTVNALSPNKIYYFKIRGGNGCMPGEWSNILKVKTTVNLDTLNKYYLYWQNQFISINDNLLNKRIVQAPVVFSEATTQLPLKAVEADISDQNSVFEETTPTTSPFYLKFIQWISSLFH